MYCENCGKRIIDGNKYCSECGTKVNNEVLSNKNSNKTLWIVIWCIFWGVILITIIIFFLSFFIIVNNVKNINYEEYDLKEYYDYENLNNSYIYNDSSDVIKIK